MVAIESGVGLPTPLAERRQRARRASTKGGGYVAAGQCCVQQGPNIGCAGAFRRTEQLEAPDVHRVVAGFCMQKYCVDR
jgi:hypothetical protein